MNKIGEEDKKLLLVRSSLLYNEIKYNILKKTISKIS